MACVPASALDTIAASLGDTERRRIPIELRITRSLAVPGPHHVNAWYEIERTRELLALHREALALLTAHRLPRRARREMLAVRTGERVSASTLRWIDRFAVDAAGPRYRPHITLGYGEPETTAPFTFRGNRLALYQLGNHCTCARRLAAEMGD